MNPERLVRASVRAMQPYTPGEQPDARDIIKLNTNENPYPPSPRIGEVLHTMDPDALRRYPDPLCRTLRAALAERHGCDARQVFVGNGSDEVLSLATRALVEDDGVIGWFDPSYSLYPVLAEARGVTARTVPLGAAFEWREPPREGIALFMVAHPNAPTGLPAPRAELTAFCETFQGVVLIDQAYADFADESYDGLALRLPNVLVARTLSKSYGLAGLRVGYALGPPPLIQALFTLKDSYNVDAIAQRLALTAVGDEAWMRTHAERIRVTRRHLTRSLRVLNWTVTDSAANFVWARPPRGAAAAVLERLRNHRILVRHFPGERTGEYLRISIGTDADIDALLDVLKRESEI